MKRVLTMILLLTTSIAALGAADRPNIVVILTDDLGYGDLSIQGHPLIRTPNIDQLAREGQRWTSFYASAPMCAPSREALITGRMPMRIHQSEKNLWQSIPDTEITLGELLKSQGYATAYIGKWGIADFEFSYKGSHPNDQGFGFFYGLSHSNDVPPRKGFDLSYQNIKNATSEDFYIPLYRQRDVVENPVYQPTLTKRYTEQSVEWINAHQDKPFFLFLAHSMPHVPLFASPNFKGQSKAGLYGDVVEELDWSIGQVMATLKKAGISDNTLVIFSSDNGPWLTYYDLGGSAGPWRDGKLTAWEGGFRVPTIFRWPDKIKPAVVSDIGVNVDLMATIASLTGTPLPTDRAYDSIDLSPTLLKGQPSPRQAWFFYSPDGDLWGARVGDYKLVYASQDSVGKDNLSSKTTQRSLWADRGYGNQQTYSPPQLFNLATDTAERLDIAKDHPEIIADIEKSVRTYQQSLLREK